MELDNKKFEVILREQLVDFRTKQNDSMKQLQGIPSEAIGTSDAGDHAQIMERQHELNSKSAMFSGRIKNVTRALKAIREDEYGFCHSCGIDLKEADLIRHPERLHCIDCLKLLEAKGKHFITS